MKLSKNDKIVNKIINDENDIKHLNEEIIFGLVIISTIVASFI